MLEIYWRPVADKCNDWDYDGRKHDILSVPHDVDDDGAGEATCENGFVFDYVPYWLDHSDEK